MQRFIANADPVCEICQGWVDKSLRYPHPQSASVDHRVPIASGGSARDPENLALTHLACNQLKGDRLSVAPGQLGSCAGLDHTSRDHTGDLVACPLGRGFHAGLEGVRFWSSLEPEP
jgi:HNH endonuclease